MILDEFKLFCKIFKLLYHNWNDIINIGFLSFIGELTRRTEIIIDLFIDGMTPEEGNPFRVEVDHLCFSAE